MNNKLAIIVYAIGKNFQHYIPIFLFSIYKSYPDYNVIIFTDCELDGNLSSQLKRIELSYNNFEIVILKEIKKYGLHNQRVKSLRWTYWYKNYFNFKYIYVGDIDIFIIKEKPTLLDQHIIHLHNLQLPISNIRRPKLKVKPNKIVSFFKTLKNDGLYNAIRILMFQHGFVEKKMSGLQFIEVEKYYKDNEKVFNKYLQYVINKKYYFKHHKDGFHNESLLFDLNKDLGIIEKIPVGTGKIEELMICSNPKGAYRPHHGLHLSLFNNPNGEIISSPIYKQYYHDFKEIEKDDLWNYIIKNANKNIVHLFKNMKIYYEHDNNQ